MEVYAKIISTALEEVKVIEYEAKSDIRGCSCPLYNQREMQQAGLDFQCFEERVYCSEKAGTLYGIHVQDAPKAQTKLLYCIEGRGLDYAVDLRKASPAYMQWTCVELSAENRKQIYIPKGFGHVFLSLEDHTRNVMRFDEPFDARYLRQIAYDDPCIGITYPISRPVLSDSDAEAPLLAEISLHL